MTRILQSAAAPKQIACRLVSPNRTLLCTSSGPSRSLHRRSKTPSVKEKCDLWRYCHYRKYFESAGRHFDDFSDGIFGKSGRRRSVQNGAHSMMNAMRYGVARDLFSNEAGMGSAAVPGDG